MCVFRPVSQSFSSSLSQVPTTKVGKKWINQCSKEEEVRYSDRKCFFKLFFSNYLNFLKTTPTFFNVACCYTTSAAINSCKGALTGEKSPKEKRFSWLMKWRWQLCANDGEFAWEYLFSSGIHRRELFCWRWLFKESFLILLFPRCACRSMLINSKQLKINWSFNYTPFFASRLSHFLILL